jgi:hypothetical protein
VKTSEKLTFKRTKHQQNPKMISRQEKANLTAAQKQERKKKLSWRNFALFVVGFVVTLMRKQYPHVEIPKLPHLQPQMTTFLTSTDNCSRNCSVFLLRRKFRTSEMLSLSRRNSLNTYQRAKHGSRHFQTIIFVHTGRVQVAGIGNQPRRRQKKRNTRDDHWENLESSWLAQKVVNKKQWHKTKA